MKTILIAALLLPSLAFAEEENLVKNGTFDVDTSGWKSQIVENDQTVAADFVEYAEAGGANGTTGCLKANVEIPGGAKCGANNTGVVCALSQPVPPGKYKLSFWAKSLSGATALSVGRLWGAGSYTSVELGTEWAHYEVTLDFETETTSDFIFAPVRESNSHHIQPVENASFLLDEVTLEPAAGSSL